MQPSLVLLHLAAAVMLLIWAVRMVRTGVERAHGARLKNAMRGVRGGSMRAAGYGAVLAVVLQSSTAVGILAAGFAASGILTISTGIATLLGADLGSALVVKILSFDLSWLIPLLILVGAILFLKFEGRAVKQTGRIVLGVAFILVSLGMIGEATQPLRTSPALPQFIAYLQGDPVSAFLIAALFTWLLHSSIAILLLLVTFAGHGILPLEVAFPMVLGANVGGGVIAVWLTRGQSLESRRIPVGNLLFRTIFALLGLLVLVTFTLPLGFLGRNEGTQLVNFHVAFNVCLLVISLPFVDLMARAVAMLLPEPAVSEQDVNLVAKPASALDRSVVPVPRLALASATRECLRMAETVELMLRPVMDMFEGGQPNAVEQVRRLDQDVNRMHTDIKLFIAEVNRGELSQDEAGRGIELTDFAINMEHVGDIIAKTLLPLVAEKKKKNLRFSDEGWREMTALHARLLTNMQLSLNVLVSGDLESARQLAKEKEIVRRLERDSHDGHLQRLQVGRAESIETSDIHLDGRPRLEGNQLASGDRRLSDSEPERPAAAKPLGRQAGDAGRPTSPVRNLSFASC